MNVWMSECPDCPLAKAKKKNIAHNQYSPTTYRRPRNAYGVDFYSIAKSVRGHVGVLTVVDLYSRRVMFIPVKDLTAETFAQKLLERVVWERGAFKVLVSDGANAFVDKIAKRLASLLFNQEMYYKNTDEQKEFVQRVKDMHEVANRRNTASQQESKERLNKYSWFARHFSDGRTFSCSPLRTFSEICSKLTGVAQTAGGKPEGGAGAMC